MQRIFSMATLAALGGLSWLFLKGGGLEQISVQPRAPGQRAPTNVAQPYRQPRPWQGATSEPTGRAQPTPAQPRFQSASTRNGSAIAPMPDGTTIRIASYNIQVFGKKKASKPNVMRILADIVRQFHVVAIQEIRSQDQYLIPNFVKLINQTGRKFDYVVGPRLGDTNVKEQYVFLFDTERIEIDFQSVYTVSDPDNLLHREPMVATFRTRGVPPDEAFTFTLVNIHTDPDLVPREMDAMGEVYRVVRRSGGGEDDIIVLGDLNTDDRNLGRLGEIPGIHPVISGMWTNTRQNKQYDNLILHRPSTTEYSGRSGVFDVTRHYNLSADQSRQVSDHFPVWAEFSVHERDHTGRIASRRRSNRR